MIRNSLEEKPWRPHKDSPTYQYIHMRLFSFRIGMFAYSLCELLHARSLNQPGPFYKDVRRVLSTTLDLFTFCRSSVLPLKERNHLFPRATIPSQGAECRRPLPTSSVVGWRGLPRAESERKAERSSGAFRERGSADKRCLRSDSAWSTCEQRD